MKPYEEWEKQHEGEMKKLRKFKDVLRQKLLEMGYETVSWTIAWYHDESSVWEGAVAQGESEAIHLEWELEEFTREHGYEYFPSGLWFALPQDFGDDYSEDIDRRWTWHLDSDEVEAGVRAYVKDPEVVYGE